MARNINSRDNAAMELKIASIISAIDEVYVRVNKRRYPGAPPFGIFDNLNDVETESVYKAAEKALTDYEDNNKE